MTRWGSGSALQLTGEQPDVRIELGILGAELLDLADGVDHRRMVATAESPADLGQRARSQLLGEIHGDLPRPGDLAGAAGRGHLRLADPVMFGNPGLDLVDRD